MKRKLSTIFLLPLIVILLLVVAMNFLYVINMTDKIKIETYENKREKT